MTGLLTPATPALLPVVGTPTELREALRGAESVGLVPTMGYLHAGHAALIERARRENSVVVVSIFVNPLQFGLGEDLARYPRDLERDRALARSAGADLIFHPEVGTMYPAGFSSSVGVGAVANALEGAARPGHFGGVATVVMKLLNMVGTGGRVADRAYFGEKDWQQLTVVRRMVRDLSHPTQVVGVPIVRAASGLALSSRNVYLTADQLTRAAVLSRALRAVQASFAAGERKVPALLEAGQEVLKGESEVKLDYLRLVDGGLEPLGTLPPLDTPAMSDSEQPRHTRNLHTVPMGGVSQSEAAQSEAAQSAEATQFRVLIAATLSGVRLIDNMPLLADPPGDSGL
ncbi:pantoate--beta-alanine ligase [Deinococcus sp.]|uniref:pantoate--beta-alanine ligase n=1 Tax=Deinococcus sp. TaxID=47478 RepID=UPI003C7ABD47